MALGGMRVPQLLLHVDHVPDNLCAGHFRTRRPHQEGFGVHRDGDCGRRHPAQADGLRRRPVRYVARLHRAHVLLRLRRLLWLQLAQIRQGRFASGSRNIAGSLGRRHRFIPAAFVYWWAHSNHMKKLLLLLAGAAALSAAPALLGGPFVVNVTRNTATVVWIVQSDELTLPSPAGAAARPYPSFRVEKTTMTGLQPNTRYDYDIPGQEGVKGWFKTAPTALQPYHFLLYGDTRTRHDVHRKVIEQILKNGIPDFALQSGDLVENGFDNALWPTFFDIERDLLRQTVLFPALGNHERDCYNFYDFFQLTNSYYSFNWGNAHFSVLNSDVANAAPTERERAAFWAEQTR